MTPLTLALTLSLVGPTPPPPAPRAAAYVRARTRRNAGAAMIGIGGAGLLAGIITGFSIGFRSFGDLGCAIGESVGNSLSSTPTPSTCPVHDYGPDRTGALTSVFTGLAIGIGGLVLLVQGDRRMEKELSLHIVPAANGGMAALSLRF